MKDTLMSTTGTFPDCSNSCWPLLLVSSEQSHDEREPEEGRDGQQADEREHFFFEKFRNHDKVATVASRTLPPLQQVNVGAAHSAERQNAELSFSFSLSNQSKWFALKFSAALKLRLFGYFSSNSVATLRHLAPLDQLCLNSNMAINKYKHCKSKE